jgi:anthranilate/para-aminobenzoate synthase component II
MMSAKPRKVVVEGQRKSGWCMDEVVYEKLGNDAEAAHYHSLCRKPEECGCPNH